MNVCIISGHLVSNAIVRGKNTKALVFTVATTHTNGDSDQPQVAHVPCVVFNPPEEIERLLTSKGKGLNIELQGRVNSARFEANSEPRSNAEVIVYTKSLHVR